MLRKAVCARFGLVPLRGPNSRPPVGGAPCSATVVASTSRVYVGMGPSLEGGLDYPISYTFDAKKFREAEEAALSMRNFIKESFPPEIELFIPVITLRNYPSGTVVVDTTAESAGVPSVNAGGSGVYTADITSHYLDPVVVAHFGKKVPPDEWISFRMITQRMYTALRCAFVREERRAPLDSGVDAVLRSLHTVATSIFGERERLERNRGILARLGREMVKDGVLVSEKATATHM
jgi:hypothetical protein